MTKTTTKVRKRGQKKERNETRGKDMDGIDNKSKAVNGEPHTKQKKMMEEENYAKVDRITHAYRW